MSWFNATEHSPELQQQGMPVGKYPVKIIASGPRASTNDPASGLLFLTCEILDGPQRGMTGQLTLNLWNKNDTSKEIAGRQLSAICHVTQTLHLDAKPEGVELWGKPFILEMAQQPDSKYTQIAGVYDVAGAPPTRATSAPAASAAQPPQQFAQAAPPATAQPQPGANPSWAGAAPQPTPQAQPQPAFGGAPSVSTAPSWAQQPASSGNAPSWAR
jgi:hypothetical protein